MSLLTTVIDDKSPLIAYSNANWAPGTAQDDPEASNYYLGTFQKNNSTGGTATLSFNGTAVWIYGANRDNHGDYTVTLDGTTYPPVNGSGNSFQQVLFNANVAQGMHTVTISNTDGPSGYYVDVDMIVWQSEVGSSGSQLVPELVQDTDPRFQYQGSSWQTTSATNLSLNLFNNGTGHVTSVNDATVSFTFISCFTLRILTGEAVTLVGTSGPVNGEYSVALDGGPAVTYNATNGGPTNYDVTIYHADNLGSGTHQLTLISLPSQSNQYLAIDYAQLWATTNSTPSPVCITSSNVASTGLGSGATAGLVVEAVIALLAAAVAVFFYRRWKAALHMPHTFYTELHRSPEMTAVTRTGIASSGAVGNNSGSLDAAAQSHQTLDGNVGAMRGRAPPNFDSNSQGWAQNEGGTAGENPFSDPSEETPPEPPRVQSDAASFDTQYLVEEPPPRYDAAVQHHYT